MFKVVLSEPHLTKFKSELNAELYADTKYYQKIYKFEIGKSGEHDTWNKEADAFKHTYGSAVLSFRYNAIAALLIGNAHEIEGKYDMGQSVEEEIMDTHNNRIGREIARQIKKDYPNWQELEKRKLKDIIAKRVMDKMNNNELIKSPVDAIGKYHKKNEKTYNPIQKNNLTGYAAPIEDKNNYAYELDDYTKDLVDYFNRLNNNPNSVLTKEQYNNEKITRQVLKKIYPKTQYGKDLESGHWVTINGNHVFIKD